MAPPQEPPPTDGSAPGVLSPLLTSPTPHQTISKEALVSGSDPPPE